MSIDKKIYMHTAPVSSCEGELEIEPEKVWKLTHGMERPKVISVNGIEGGQICG